MSDPKKIIPVGDNFADIHKTADTLRANDPDNVNGDHAEAMATNNVKEKFWTLANLRLTVINTIIVGVVAVTAAWTSNLLTQQALAARVDKLETTTAINGTNRDQAIRTLSDKIDAGVTKEVLKLQLDPINKELGEQRAILERIQIAVVRSTPPY